ncbi:MAG: hypothetical protein ACRDJO_09665, partial [Actinomycetota bacterium]
VDPDPRDVERILGELAHRATEALMDQGSSPAELVRMVDCRYKGQWHELAVPADPIGELPARFAAEHRKRYGWDVPGEPVELVTFRVQARGAPPEITLPTLPAGGRGPAGRRRVFTAAGEVEAPLWQRGDLGAGDRLPGPCIVAGEESTTVIDEGWEAEVSPHGVLVARRAR